MAHKKLRAITNVVGGSAGVDLIDASTQVTNGSNSRTVTNHDVDADPLANTTDDQQESISINITVSDVIQGACQIDIVVQSGHDSDVIFEVHTPLTTTSTLPHTISVSFRFQGGYTQETFPTYLEELHKLDNYSKAQYFPNKRKLSKGLF